MTVARTPVRILSYFIDLSVSWFILIGLGSMNSLLRNHLNLTLGNALGVMIFILFFAYPTLINGFLTFKYGGSVGKLATGLRVSELKLGQAILRETIKFLHLILFPLMFISVYKLSTDKQKQAIHDKAVNSVVFAKKPNAVRGILVLIGIIIAMIALAILSFKLIPVPEYTDGVGSVAGNELEGIPVAGIGVAPSTEVDSPSHDYEFTLTRGTVSTQNKLVIEGTAVEISGVVHAMWSRNSEFIIFSKTELEFDLSTIDPSMPNIYHENSSNIWVVEPNGSNPHQIYDDPGYSTMTFVSNGETIAFANAQKIGLIDKNGNNLRFVHQFEGPDTPGHIYVPEVKTLDQDTFVAEIKATDYTTSQQINVVELKFDQ